MMVNKKLQLNLLNLKLLLLIEKNPKCVLCINFTKSYFHQQDPLLPHKEYRPLIKRERR